MIFKLHISSSPSPGIDLINMEKACHGSDVSWLPPCAMQIWRVSCLKKGPEVGLRALDGQVGKPENASPATIMLDDARMSLQVKNLNPVSVVCNIKTHPIVSRTMYSNAALLSCQALILLLILCERVLSLPDHANTWKYYLHSQCCHLFQNGNGWVDFSKDLLFVFGDNDHHDDILSEASSSTTTGCKPEAIEANDRRRGPRLGIARSALTMELRFTQLLHSGYKGMSWGLPCAFPSRVGLNIKIALLSIMVDTCG